MRAGAVLRETRLQMSASRASPSLGINYAGTRYVAYRVVYMYCINNQCYPSSIAIKTSLLARPNTLSFNCHLPLLSFTLRLIQSSILHLTIPQRSRSVRNLGSAASPDKHVMADDGSDFEYYHYDPTMVGAVIFIILFLATTTLHCYQLFRTRVWFMIPFDIGGFCRLFSPL